MKRWWHEHVHGLPTRALLPVDYNPKRRHPLLISLHGSTERGSDNVAPLTHGVTGFEHDPLRRFGAIVVAPQAPRAQPCCGCRYGGETSTQPALMALTHELVLRDSVDSERVDLVGFSMGAIGLWDIKRCRCSQVTPARH